MSRFSIVVAVVVLAGLVPGTAHAQTTGDIKVTVGRAYDPTGDIDPFDPAFYNDQADFYCKASVGGGALMTSSPPVSNKDEAELNFVVTQSVPLSDRFHMVHIELWDSDQPFGETQCDVNPTTGKKSLDLTFDACAFTWTGDAVGGRGGQRVRGGGDDNIAEVTFDIDTGDGKPFSPDDVAIHDAYPVQVTFDDDYIVSGKATVFRVSFTSSYTVPRDGTVTVTATDGVGNVFGETRSVTVPPEGTTIYLFDGSNGVTPFVPFGTSNGSELCWTVSADFGVEGPPTLPGPPFDKCYIDDNVVANTCRRFAFIDNPSVGYLPFDWDQGPATAPPTPAASAATFSAGEPFRVASTPIPFSNATLAPGPFTGLAEASAAEPVISMLRMAPLAMAAGLDRLILMPRNGWFADNASTLDFGVGAIGISLGEFLPRVVIAEEGWSEVSTHELGHTYRLSRHPCSTGEPWETLFDVGCRDEYTHTAADGRPYPASGFDVLGLVYPSGASPMTPGTREVFSTNFMDSTSATPGAAYDRWVDALNYNYLLQAMSAGSLLPPAAAAATETDAISVTGLLQATNGIETDPPTFSVSLLPSFLVDAATSGFDRDEPAIGQTDGRGPFAIVFVTPQGPRTYRFQAPFFLPDDNVASDYGGFSLALPFDPNTTRIELYGPTDLYHPEQNQDQLLAAVDRTDALPAVQNVRAGIDTPPTQAGPQPEPPTIPPGHTVGLSWEESDADSQTLARDILLLPPPQVHDGPVPLGADLAGPEFVMSQIVRDALPPGDYGVEILVSDGVNSTTHPESLAFRLCEFANGGVEACDGLDDDCNGSVDDVTGQDGDNDGVDDACDCAPADPGAFAVPAVVTGLRVDPSPQGPDYVLLSWDSLASQAGPGVVYDAMAGDVASLHGQTPFQDGTCVLVDVQGTSATAYRPAPPPGEGSWFLLRGQTSCGAGSYDSGDPSQSGGRDGPIAGSAGPCA